MQKFQQRLNSVSASFCLAKWLQVTLHLHNGNTHSCHHPDTHQADPEEIKRNPSALHNTAQKKSARKQMLAGEKPPECDYCWRIEGVDSSCVSDRMIKSSDAWAISHFDEVAALPWDKDVDPTYVEVNFGSLCNLKCSYCAPHISSSWMKEIEEHGGYPTTSRFNDLEQLRAVNKLPLKDSENPYLEAFWKWWPSLYPKLEMLRITGGEPLLNENTFRVLDHINEHPRPDLEIAVNSNMSIPQPRFERFRAMIRPLLEQKKVKMLTVYTSIDTWGKQAEYIRHGLRHDRFWRNVRKVLKEHPELRLTFMCTFNALSVTSFRRLLEEVLELKRSHPAVHLDISYLAHPQHQTVKILTPEYTDQVEELVKFMEEHRTETWGTPGFLPMEIEKMHRLHQWMKRPENENWVRTCRKDFYRFFTEHDRRRGTDFLKAFPEMAGFWNLCKDLAESDMNSHTGLPPGGKPEVGREESLG